MAAHASLVAAKAVKNDEFYTQWNDIENEMNAYLDCNQDAFRGKVVLLPCDDPEWSNFTKFFAMNFEEFGLKKLISTSYTPRGNGRIFVMESGSKSDGGIEWERLDGDGDFRSDEVTVLRDEADMVITNPPFSLYREFVAWLINGGVEYSIIGNTNSVTYKEIFPLIKDNKMWVGANLKGGSRRGNSLLFTVPENSDIKNPVEYGGKMCTQVSAWWFTNIGHYRRHEPLELMTMKDNIRHCRRKAVRERGYPKYDNYDAIEVSFTEAVPSDYDGIMGVPISFLGKHSPEQFEIVGCSYDYGRPTGWGKNVSMSAVIDGKNIYKRIFIRPKKQSEVRG